MSAPFGKSTAPAAAASVGPESTPPCLALIIAWSKSEPHRVGEIAFIAPDETLFLGRGDAEIEKFMHFVRQLPGEIPAVDPHEALLAGASISKRQLSIHSTGTALEIERLGSCPMLVHGAERDKVTLRPGQVVRLRDELVLLCVLRSRMLPRHPSILALHPFGEPDANGIVGESPEAWAMRGELAAAAPFAPHVLIQAESGAGKELAARAIHKQSTRAKGPLIACNASALPRELVVAELFGNIANYPNGGMPARKGLVGEADRGSLFLDEIGDLPFEAQSPLLRILDSGEYQCLGDGKPRRADLRVIGATNRDDSFFRPDFLSRFPIRVGLRPLRKRREDIPLLIRHLVLLMVAGNPKAAERLLIKAPNGRLEPRVSGRLVEHLVTHDLPTNVRQLGMILMKAVLDNQEDELTLPVETAPAQLLVAPAPGQLRTKESVAMLMKLERGNKARVARVLGISRGALYRDLESWGMEPEKKKKSK
jgi:two-component system response regulator HydG